MLYFYLLVDLLVDILELSLLQNNQRQTVGFAKNVNILDGFWRRLACLFLPCNKPYTLSFPLCDHNKDPAAFPLQFLHDLCVAWVYNSRWQKRGIYSLDSVTQHCSGRRRVQQTDWQRVNEHVCLCCMLLITEGREQSRHTQKAVHSTLWCSGYGFERRHPWCSADQCLQVFLLRHKKTQLWQA